MKSKMTFATLTLILLSLVPGLHATCSTASVSSDFTLTGVVLLPGGPVPVAAVSMAQPMSAASLPE